MIPGAVAAIVRGFSLAAAVPIFAASSSAPPGLFNTFFPTLSAAFPRCLKQSSNPSASIV